MTSSPESVEERIKIRVSNQKGYLWDLNGSLFSLSLTPFPLLTHPPILREITDIQKLRVQHHICGSLQGTLPQVTQQNVFLGLPLVLLPEEVVLLVKNRSSLSLSLSTVYTKLD